ncbi:LOW QUALITY PROTEIN: katanin p80 WD40 repeat-containing subunit B1 [Diaphorina citri]|uniref:Katanin p80 WD40 repeat-containing subunit B1 n=1 Tax=Diaphorina citri TaxID=121845 RepID=A0A3Q0IZA8_DIACI|nr:LOW QUALITY PROTEIN: katanin p80 WD40 repeat-containing subunit B1 [Diaphorina citri]
MTSPVKRAWKLQDFMAHGASVNCLALGKKSGQVLATGGDDKKVNLWALGKSNCIMSLSGHSTPVESVQFGNGEETLSAGCQSGSIKIWNLAVPTVQRTLNGHKSSITSVDFHPYGDYLCSGSLDSFIKLWDLRRKGCIYTYRGHSKSINSIRFSPDGQWIASGGEDGVVRIWDLRAGKRISDLTQHTAPVTDVVFHPHEFLLASSSADRTVNFWDLEKFSLVSTTEKNSSTIRRLTFSEGGECLLGGDTEGLKVYGWEPARQYDAQPMGWGKVQDLAVTGTQLGFAGSEHGPSAMFGPPPSMKHSQDSGFSTLDSYSAGSPVSTMGRERDQIVPMNLSAPIGLDMEQFLPKSYQTHQGKSSMSESELMSTIFNGHDKMMAVLRNRQRSLGLVYMAVNNKNMEAGIDTALSMNDGTVMIDLFKSMLGQGNVWNLELCSAILPVIQDLLQSKYEMYITTACDTLNLILRTFGPVIKNNMKWSGGSIGVDISKEER